jgi:hypothetical protein
MKKFAYAASAALAAMALAPAAQAVVVDEIDLSVNTDDSFSADSVISPETFGGLDFVLPAGYYLAEVSAAVTGGVTWRFTDIKFDGISVLTGLYSGGKFLDGTFLFSTPGPHTLSFIGTGVGSFGGSISITAVPEPTTWALMLAGVAAVGTALRRRSTLARVSFS